MRQINQTGFPDRSPEASALIGRLKEGKPGEILTDEELEKVCGKNTAPNQDGYCYLQTAIKYVLKHHRLVWARIRNGGYIQCAQDEMKLNIGKGGLEHIRRRSKTTARVLQTIEIDKLSADQKNVFNVSLTMLNTVHLFSKRETAVRLAPRLVENQPDPKKLLEFFEKA